MNILLKALLLGKSEVNEMGSIASYQEGYTDGFEDGRKAQMNNDKIIEALKVYKTDLIKDLAYINGKHDALTNQLGYINGLIEELQDKKE